MGVLSFFKKQAKEWCCPVTGMEFIWVHGGTFDRGNTHYSVPPIHKIKIKGFWLGKFLVTQQVWMDAMGNKPSYSQKGGKYPVERVSWNDVQEFINTLNGSGKTKFRFPTEAEWEYACRSGGKKEDFSGCTRVTDGAIFDRSDDINRVAWYEDNSKGSTHPVGEKVPNGLGLYDMSGNVSEWVQDWYKSDYSSSTMNNPTGPDSGTYRVHRGGCYGSDQKWVNCGRRGNERPDKKSERIGCRLAISFL